MIYTHIIYCKGFFNYCILFYHEIINCSFLSRYFFLRFLVGFCAPSYSLLHSFIAELVVSIVGPIQIELIGKDVKVSRDMAIFITMNPGYAGRSNLPDNLKKLFRNLAMTKPDGQLIAQVMLYSQGFRTAEKLASKIVPFFK